jgi:hypothetical protein
MSQPIHHTDTVYTPGANGVPSTELPVELAEDGLPPFSAVSLASANSTG